MERLGSSSVAGANFSTLCDERLRDASVMGGGGNMQSGVAGVDVMPDREKEVGLRILAARTGPEGAASQVRPLAQDSRGPHLVARGDRSEECTHRCLIRFPISLRHAVQIARSGTRKLP